MVATNDAVPPSASEYQSGLICCQRGVPAFDRRMRVECFITTLRRNRIEDQDVVLQMDMGKDHARSTLALKTVPLLAAGSGSEKSDSLSNRVGELCYAQMLLLHVLKLALLYVIAVPFHQIGDGCRRWSKCLKSLVWPKGRQGQRWSESADGEASCDLDFLRLRRGGLARVGAFSIPLMGLLRSAISAFVRRSVEEVTTDARKIVPPSTGLLVVTSWRRAGICG